MTLTELRYLVALARERHFGKAAEACHVAQPTLSIAIKKLENELDVQIFERHAGEVGVSDLGQRIIEQAKRVLEQAHTIKQIANAGKDPLNGPLHVGVIYTAAPYVLPQLVRQNIRLNVKMPLMLQENFTERLLELLAAGEIDCAILAEPFSSNGLATAPLYDEFFWAVVPTQHALAQQESIRSVQLKDHPLLLLGHGHCFRDHVLQACPEFMRLDHATMSSREAMRRGLEGSSLETLKHMVAAGLGVTLVPGLSVPRQQQEQDLLRYLPIVEAEEDEPPKRRMVLVWRRNFSRYGAIAALRNAIYACDFPGVQWLRPGLKQDL